MRQQEIHQYIQQFFNENKCRVLDESDEHLTVQLTIDMDKRIMNRPFYWSYVESGGVEPNPAKLTLITNPSQFATSMAGERLHFGSPRLHQLFQVTKEQGAFVQLYEKPGSGQTSQVTLTPWLGVNYKITYSSDRTKESLYSLGMNLMNGAVIDGFQESVRKLELAPSVSANTYYLPYIIPPVRALDRLEDVMENVVNQDDHTWVDEAKQRQVKDLRVLDYFYTGVEDVPESYHIEKKAIEEQYETTIRIEIINGGLFYLKTPLL
ncbi:YqhG family protein [Sporosarcina jeotgali]|uniref:YqhG family protein n=1 Tax=Sporosarcina jeotgali TaxID=3020056 RepID=A0ABZ0KTS4_9BACL|nr:YqhG family protein [Sporosarcina sp. B2O-1]WOV83841.1 YqhG family protein [Sporosarcina sp. B2O-1]